MIEITPFSYVPEEHETEAASNSYLMSLVAAMVGLPLPIVNLLATFGFYLGHRKSTAFVRWHCTQALLSQLGLFFANSFGFWWTVSILFSDQQLSNAYFGYMITLVVFNLWEFITTLVAAIQVRKGKHVKWWFFGALTDLFIPSGHA
jgi:uncharacterized Tic20 family protein